MSNEQMATPPGDAEHQTRYAEAIRASAAQGADAFQTWFSRADDARAATIRGAWDWSIHILTPTVCALISQPEEKTVLEIGYGGGRILNAACGYFKTAIGIDIHGEADAVTAYLREAGRTNFQLIKTAGRTIEVDSDSIDFIYSFIVLNHLPSFEVFESYLRETRRCLKRGGVAQLYFGRFSRQSLRDQARYFWQGYRELPNQPVNYTSLLVRTGKVKQMARELGLRAVDAGESYDRAPDGYPGKRGRQSYVTLVKER